MHDIRADMHLANQEDVYAYGTVTLDHWIKFPVQMRKFQDKDTGEEKAFLSFPRRKQNGVWKDVVYPDQELRQEIEIAVGNAIKEEISKELHLPKVEEVMVTPLEPKLSTDAKAVICGLASVKICGLTIHGITIKRTENATFINMPQYFSDGYKDIVHGTSKKVQQVISEAVLSKYKERIKEKKPQVSIGGRRK